MQRSEPLCGTAMAPASFTGLYTNENFSLHICSDTYYSCTFKSLCAINDFIVTISNIVFTMSFPLSPVTPPTPSRCSKMTHPYTPLAFKIYGLSRDTAPSEDHSSNVVIQEEQRILPLKFGVSNTKISASKVYKGHSNKTAQKSKVHPSSDRKLYQALVELEAHKNTFEDCQKPSSKNTPPDENCDRTSNPVQQLSSGVVAERPSQGALRRSSHGVFGQSSHAVLEKRTQENFSRQDDTEAGTGLQENHTGLRSLNPAQEQDISRRQIKSSSHSDDALPPPKQAARRSKRINSPANKISGAEQPQEHDREQSDNDGDEGNQGDEGDEGDEGSNSPKDKTSTEASADNVAQKATAFYNKLRLTLEGNLLEKDCEGYVYIFLNPARPKHLKIGRSKESSYRIDGINQKCGLELVEVMKIWVSFQKRTELLIQAYFSDLLDVHICSECKRKHKEWFKVARESAIAALIKWTKFMETDKPYDLETGQLRPFFREWIKKQEPFFVGGDGQATREHWDRMLAINCIDRYLFKFNIVWELFWKFYWQINTMFAWTVTFLVVRHPLTFLLLGASVVGTFICMSDDHNQPRSLRKSPRKSLEK